MSRKVLAADAAKELAREAWVERASREKGDLDLSDFEKRAAESAFERWWDKEVDT